MTREASIAHRKSQKPPALAGGFAVAGIDLPRTDLPCRRGRIPFSYGKASERACQKLDEMVDGDRVLFCKPLKKSLVRERNVRRQPKKN